MKFCLFGYFEVRILLLLDGLVLLQISVSILNFNVLKLAVGGGFADVVLGGGEVC